MHRVPLSHAFRLAVFAVMVGLALHACSDSDSDTPAVPDTTTTSTVDPASTTASLFIPTTSIPDPACEEIIGLASLTSTLNIKPINGVASEAPDGSLTCVYDFVEGTALEAVTITVLAGKGATFTPGGLDGFDDVQPPGAVGEVWLRTSEADGSARLYVVIEDDLFEVGVVREGGDPTQAGTDPLAVALANRLINLRT